jgi:hypothetical protein
MGTRVASLYSEVSADTTKSERGLRSVRQDLKQTEQGFKSMGTSGVKNLALIAAAATSVGFALKQAFAIAREGAAVAQTAESWETLNTAIGASPGLLNQLKEASRGTVSELELMNSTSLLLAGTQGQLSRELTNATPQLLEIAKAAAKLNPSLGTTTFLYDSLSRGIKRNSPLILDNLGIVVSIEEANQKYAASRPTLSQKKSRRSRS